MDKAISDLLLQVGAFGIGIAAVGYLIEKITKVILMVKDRGSTQGAVGPQGERGPAGINGATGAAGATGRSDRPCAELIEVRRKLDEKEQNLQDRLAELVKSVNDLKLEVERRMTKMETLIKVYNRADQDEKR